MQSPPRAILCLTHQTLNRWHSYCVQVKMHWVHENYWQPGPQGNDIQKTNVPNLRMRFRFDNHQEEVCRSLPS